MPESFQDILAHKMKSDFLPKTPPHASHVPPRPQFQDVGSLHFEVPPTLLRQKATGTALEQIIRIYKQKSPSTLQKKIPEFRSEPKPQIQDPPFFNEGERYPFGRPPGTPHTLTEIEKAALQTMHNEFRHFPRDFTQEDLKVAFRYLAKNHHPDKGGDSTKYIFLKTNIDLLKKKIK